MVAQLTQQLQRCGWLIWPWYLPLLSPAVGVSAHPRWNPLWQKHLVLTNAASPWWTPCFGRNCDLRARPRQMRALMILKLILNPTEETNGAEPPTSRVGMKSAGFRSCSVGLASGALGACRPMALHAGQSPWI